MPIHSRDPRARPPGVFDRNRAVLVRHRLAALALLSIGSIGSAASCDRCGGADPSKDRKDAALVDAALSAAPSAATSVASSRDAAPSTADAATSLIATPPTDAGPSSCRLAYGPAEQPFRGPAAMVVTPTELRLVANDGGKPRIFPVPLGPPPASASSTAPSVVPPSPSAFVAMRWPPCEMAGRWAYCQAAGGAVYRTTLGGTDTKQIAKSQPSTRIAASTLGPDHAIVATLDARHTTEGVMMQAFVTLDDGETQRLSDEGAGATVVRLVPRGDRAVALYLDVRTAMVPVHARPLSLRGKDLAIAEDAVVFVGGPPERGVELTAAGSGRSLFALVPMARETTDFGMAAIPIAEQPKDDVQPAWSFYPNGIDPAPIAATVPDGGAGASWVARVRPSERAPGSPRVLELGRLDAAGAFTTLGTISTGKRITDLAIASDAHGSVWILYGDTNATWLERRVCP